MPCSKRLVLSLEQLTLKMIGLAEPCPFGLATLPADPPDLRQPFDASPNC
jgi:hypothetical protein